MKTIGGLRPHSFLPTAKPAAASLPPWASGKNGKEYRSTLGRKPIGGIFSVGTEEPYRWKDSVQSGPEIRLWAIEGIANDLRPWYTKFGGTLYDESAGSNQSKISTSGTTKTSATSATKNR